MSALPNKKTLDFSQGFVHGVANDTGGFTHHYLSQNRDVELGVINMAYTQDAYDMIMECPCPQCQTRYVMPCQKSLENLCSYGDFNAMQAQYIKESLGDNSEFYLNSHFFHYRCGSNKEKISDTKLRLLITTFMNFCLIKEGMRLHI
jgi:hypothetical protein